MSHRIPDSFLEDLTQRVSLADVIQSYGVTLKKSGANHFGLCPFHHEKSPSFSVNEDKGFYYCFGCGASGNAISFVSEHTGIPFREAVSLLSSQVGMEMPKKEFTKQDAAKQAKRDYLKKLEALMESAASWFQEQLKTNEGSFARHYLVNIRQLGNKAINDYGLGYAPDRWDALKNYLLAQGYTQKMLIDAGMVVVQEGQNTSYDRFRNRIIFPIRNTRGKVVAFGGRVLDDSKPKYLNSPETLLYNKSTEVYGLLQAKRNYRSLSRLLLVEGYMDVVTLADAGIGYATAPLGTSVTKEQISKLLQVSSSLVICFDGDTAGQNAAARALDMLAPHLFDVRDIRFMFLPENQDPDDFLQSVGVDTFNNLLDQALPALDYILKLALGHLNLSFEGDKITYTKNIAQWLEKIPKGLLSIKLVQVACGQTGFSEAEIRSLVNHNQSVGENKYPNLLTRNLYPLFVLLWSKPAMVDAAELAHLSKLLDTLKSSIDENEQSIRLFNNVQDLIQSILTLLQPEPEMRRKHLTQLVLHYYWHDTPLLHMLDFYRQQATPLMVDIPVSEAASLAMYESIAQIFAKNAGKVQLNNSNQSLSDRFATLKQNFVTKTPRKISG